MKALWTPTLILALAIAACGDDGGTTKTDTGLDTIFPDAGDTTPGDTVNPNAVRLLDFELAFGADNKPCRQQPRCLVYLSFSEQKELKMVYTEDGAPVSGVTVKFAVENDPNGLAQPTALAGITEADGIGKIAIKPKRNEVGQFVIKAYVEGGTNPPPAKYFDIVVTPKGTVPLTVIATYGGTRPVSSYSVRLYKQNAQGSPGCGDLNDLYENGTATTARDGVQLSQSAKFPDFDGLATDKTQKYTILAFSLNANQKVQAWVCNATDGVVEDGKSKTVEVAMTDRAPLYVGAYDVISKFDFVSAIPEPYGTYVDYVVSFFQDPTGTLLEIACDLLTGEGETLNSFCDLVFDEVGGELQLTALGEFASDLLNAVITGLARDSIFDTIFTVGGDVADILKEFELRATIQFKKEPDATGKFADGDATENWHTVRVKWTLGANCDPDTEAGCGTIQQNLQQFGYSGGAITGTFGASVAAFYNLTIDQHPLNLRYGALLSFFAERLLIPLIIHGTDTSTWVVDRYEELLGYLLGGGSECLTASTSDATNCPDIGEDVDCCCAKFADSIGQATSAVARACDVIVGTAPSFLRNTLENLDVESGDAFSIGTLEACRMNDTNDDLIIDGFGTIANPCKWNVVLKFGANTTVTIDSKFFATRAEE